MLATKFASGIHCILAMTQFEMELRAVDRASLTDCADKLTASDHVAFFDIDGFQMRVRADPAIGMPNQDKVTESL